MDWMQTTEASDTDDDELFTLSLQYKCPYKWRDMKGDNQTRHCSKCQQNVYNISTMTKQEAVNLIQEQEGELCVPFYQRPDGTVITRDCVSIVGRQDVKQKGSILAMLNAYLETSSPRPITPPPGKDFLESIFAMLLQFMMLPNQVGKKKGVKKRLATKK